MCHLSFDNRHQSPDKKTPTMYDWGLRSTRNKQLITDIASLPRIIDARLTRKESIERNGNNFLILKLPPLPLAKSVFVEFPPVGELIHSVTSGSSFAGTVSDKFPLKTLIVFFLSVKCALQMLRADLFS